MEELSDTETGGGDVDKEGAESSTYRKVADRNIRSSRTEGSNLRENNFI